MMMMNAWHSIMNPEVSMYIGNTTRVCRAAATVLVTGSGCRWWFEAQTNKQTNKPTEEHKKVFLLFVRRCRRIASESFWRQSLVDLSSLSIIYFFFIHFGSIHSVGGEEGLGVALLLYSFSVDVIIANKQQQQQITDNNSNGYLRGTKETVRFLGGKRF